MSSDKPEKEAKPKKGGGIMMKAVLGLVLLGAGGGGVFGLMAAGVIGGGHEEKKEDNKPKLIRKGEEDPYAPKAEGGKEALVKAAFIFNFVKFISWPGERAIATQSSIDICVLGDSDLSSAASVFKQASSAKLALQLVPERSAKSAVTHCHIVFVGDSEEGKLSDVMASLKGQPVLTVSDISNFAERGGMIGFVLTDNKIKLAVNKRAIESAGLKVDAQLLEIALKVIDR